LSPELITAFASVGTFVVIAASAIAALVQLRHLRQSNQLSGLLSVLELFQQPRVHELIDFMRHELPEKMENPDFRAGLERSPIDRREHPELHLCDLYDQIGSYVRTGLVDESLFLQASWFNIVLNWTILEPVVTICRRTRPNLFENFEFLAGRAVSLRQRHPHGIYASAPPPVDLQSARAMTAYTERP
jgi:hypothetical protein